MQNIVQIISIETVLFYVKRCFSLRKYNFEILLLNISSETRSYAATNISNLFVCAHVTIKFQLWDFQLSQIS